MGWSWVERLCMRRLPLGTVWRRVSGVTLAAPALTTAAAALAAAALAAAALAAALAATALAAAIRLHINRRHVGGWASSVPVSRRRSRKHPQRRGERRCVGRRPSIRRDVDRSE